MLLLLMFGIGVYASAQTTITGVVTSSEDNSPLPGVSVAVKGSSIGTTTNPDGFFSITIPSEKVTLVFSYIGFLKREIVVSESTGQLRVEMKEDTQLLDEVVVVGYGTMRKSDLSGSSISIGEEKLKGSIITNLDQALQGRAAGVSSVMTSGAPGSSVSIRIRGQATINANAEPLYVIDGVPFQGGGNSGADFGLGDALGNGTTSTISPMSTINPSDILSMEILKDASATAIYGAQGSNGVVLITTKKGKAGEAKFSYEGLIGLQEQTSRLKMMNLRQFAEYSNAFAAETNGQDERIEFRDPSLLGKGTNWQDAVFRRALIQQHQFSARGGTEKITYYLSGSYTDQEGTIIGTEFERYSFRANIDAQMKKWLKLGLNVTYASTDERLGLADSNEGIISYSLLTPPDIPIYDIDGNFASEVRKGYTSVNPIAMALNDDILLGRKKLTGNIYADIIPLKNFTWRTELGFDISESKAELFEPTINLGSWKRSANLSSWQRNNSNFWQLKNYLTYANTFAEVHYVTAMIGQEAWESTYDYMSMATGGLPSDNIKNPQLGEDPKINSGFGSSSMASFFGRTTYNYSDRYMGTYTYRRDGSSNFGPDKRWANFHSFAASWRFSNEQFFAPLQSVITNGKLRLGWGQTGNASIGSYLWGASISRMPTGLGTGYRQSNIANPGIQWETQEQYNLGLDLGFLGDRINMVVDLYDKTSKDMLMPLQLPSYMGASEKSNASSRLNPPWGNYGEINNKGLEISLNTKNLKGAFEWDTDLQISFNKNKLVALDGTDAAQIEGYGQWTDVVAISEVGKSLYNFYGYKVAGIYEDLEDLNNSPKPEGFSGVYNRYNTVWVGDLKFADISGPEGTPDGVINSYDRTVIGSPMPDFTFGITNTFRYKNFDLTLFLNGSVGNDILNYTSVELCNMKSSWNNQLRKVSNRTTLEPIDAAKQYPITYNGAEIWHWFDDISNVRIANKNVDIPRAIANDPNDNDRISDRYIEDGSYLRIKNITLGYTLPTSLTNKWKIEGLRVYVNLQNVHTFTGYSGYDPEVGASTTSNYVYGLDNGRYPSPFVYTVGLNFSF